MGHDQLVVREDPPGDDGEVVPERVRWWSTPTLAIVWHCWLPVERYAAHGREIRVPRSRCPDCREEMVFWSGYWRYGREGGEHRLFIRRSCCQPCGRTHALLPSFLLRRRLDSVWVIGRAVVLGVGGLGMGKVAAQMGVPHSTARDWRRRHRARAPALVAGLAALRVELGDEVISLPGDPEQAALAALGALWAPRQVVVELWALASLVSGGAWLSTNTTPLWATLGDRRFMAPMPPKPTQEVV